MNKLEPLTGLDRVRLVAGLGRLVFTASEIDWEVVELLLKLSETRVWVQTGT
jgi:hypothetical protein